MLVMEVLGLSMVGTLLLLVPYFIEDGYCKIYKKTIKKLRDTDEVIPVLRMKKLVRYKSHELDETRWTDEHELMSV